MQKFFVGVDGGGTKTALCALDSTGKVIARSQSGPINYNFIDFDQAVENLMLGIAGLNLPVDRIKAIGVGDPSIDDLPDTESAKRFIDKIEEKTGAKVFSRSDAYMSLYSLLDGGVPSALVIAGTGAIALGEDKEGKVHVAGGWGRLTGDEGSGYYIALEGLRAVMHYSDGVGPKTALSDCALEYFSAKCAREIATKLYGAEQVDIAGFSKEVYACALNGDGVANEILYDCGRKLSIIAIAVIDRCNAKQLGTYGGVLQNNDIVRDVFLQKIRAKYPDISIKGTLMRAEESAGRYAIKKYKEQL